MGNFKKNTPKKVGNYQFPAVPTFPFPLSHFPIPTFPLLCSHFPTPKMTQFNLTTTERKQRKIRKTSTVYLCLLSFPSSLKEQMPHASFCELKGQKAQAFYDVPVAGDEVELWGCEWNVRARKHYPYTPYSRGEKKVSEIYLDFVALLPQAEQENESEYDSDINPN